MKLHRPTRLKQGRATYIEDQQWDKEYRTSFHRINYMEEVVKTGNNFGEIEVRNRDPPAADPKFRIITVEHENSRPA